MKTTKKYSGIIEWILAIILVLICLHYFTLSCGSFSPIKAHEKSERTFHYGPSKIIKTIDLKDTKIYLCKYKDWYSADTVKKDLIRWYSSGGIAGNLIDYSKQVSYSWEVSHIKDNISLMKTYGYVNDSNITTILGEEISGDNTIKYNLDENRMFIFYHKGDEKKHRIKYLKGLNKDGKIIYEEDLIP